MMCPRRPVVLSVGPHPRRLDPLDPLLRPFVRVVEFELELKKGLLLST